MLRTSATINSFLTNESVFLGSQYNGHMQTSRSKHVLWHAMIYEIYKDLLKYSFEKNLNYVPWSNIILRGWGKSYTRMFSSKCDENIDVVVKWFCCF